MSALSWLRYLTSPPNWRAHTMPPCISFWCSIATAACADFTLVKSTAEASILHPSSARPRKFAFYGMLLFIRQQLKYPRTNT